MYRKRSQRKIIIYSLIGILFLMVVGYAAFSTTLEIKGTSKVTSNWDIEITYVTPGTPTGSAENAVAPSFDKLWASMEANLYDKGDAMEYDVTIENKGTLDAKLNDILTNVEKENNEAVLITFSGYTKGEILKAKTSKVVHVKIEYNPEYEGGETSSEVEINFDYVQNNNETNNPDNQYLVTYDYHTNGGTNADIKEEYYASGSNINLENTAYKEGWTFIGWNTDKDANIGLTNIEIKENTTLYAIYSKTLKVTYEKGENIESIGKNEDSCNIYNNNTSCEITLPEIISTIGYNPDGWYVENSKVGNINDKYNLNNNKNLIAKAIDNIKPTPPVLTNTSNGNWTNQDIKVTITSTDEGSGIDHYEWNNNGVWTSSNIVMENGVGIVTFTNDNNTDIEFRAIDKAGNISEISVTPIKIDKTAPECTSSGESNKWIALTQTIKGTCIDEGSGCKDTQISKTYSIAENITGNYDNSYSPGIVEDNVGNTTTCPSVKVRVTGTTIKDYTEGAVFMYDGKTGLNNTTWQDQSGNGRNGTLVGAVKSGDSVYFDGVDDYVRIAELNYQAVTLETSFKATDFNDYAMLMANVQDGGYELYIDTNNNYKLTSGVHKNGKYIYNTSDKILINNIYYASLRSNNTTDFITLNDITTKINSVGTIKYPEGNTYLILGGNPYENYSQVQEETFNGYIYTARMYSKVLTDDELQKHYVIDKWRFNF